MEVLRTSDERFADLDGYAFRPHYTTVSPHGTPIRVHHVDEGSGPVILLMHGEPSWSYLYRTMIPPLTEAGFRCVAPDLVGFGKSDKPARTEDHSYQRHVDWMAAWLEAVDLEHVTLFCQDWGGLIGLRLATAFPHRFARLVVANTGLPTGDQQMPDAFLRWQAFAATVPKFPIAAMVDRATVNELSPAILAGYDAPFPDETYKAGPRIMPSLVPTRPDDPSADAQREAWQVRMAWDKPVLTTFSDSDPITAGGDRVFHKLVPGASGQPHTTIASAGHFLQEDQGPAVAQVVADFHRLTS